MIQITFFSFLFDAMQSADMPQYVIHLWRWGTVITWVGIFQKIFSWLN